METQTSTSTTYSEDGVGRDPTRPDPSDSQRSNQERSAISSSQDHLSLHHSSTEPSLANKSNKITDSDANLATSCLKPWQSTPSIPKTVKEDTGKDIRYDAMILYSDDDKEAAEIFKEHLYNDIELAVGGPVSAVLYNGPELEGLSGLNFEHLDLAFQKCSYTFVYLTKAFVENTWCKITSESCLMRQLTSKANEKMRWRVVPVYTESRDDCTFQIPMGLNALKGINYYKKDDFYRKGVAALINQTREQNETEQQIKKTKTVIYDRKKFEMDPQTNIDGLKERLSARDSSSSEGQTVQQMHIKKERRDHNSSHLQLQVPLRQEGDKYVGIVDDYGSPLDQDYMLNTPKLSKVTLADEVESHREWQLYSAGQKEMTTGCENNNEIAKNQRCNQDIPRSRETEYYSNHQSIAASLRVDLSLQLVGNTGGIIHRDEPGATADIGNPRSESPSESLVPVGVKTECNTIGCDTLFGTNTETPSVEMNNAAKRLQSFQHMADNSACKKSPKSDKNSDTCSKRTTENSSNSAHIRHVKEVDNCSFHCKREISWTFGGRQRCKISNFFCTKHIFSAEISSDSELPCDLSEPD